MDLPKLAPHIALLKFPLITVGQLTHIVVVGIINTMVRQRPPPGSTTVSRRYDLARRLPCCGLSWPIRFSPASGLPAGPGEEPPFSGAARNLPEVPSIRRSRRGTVPPSAYPKSAPVGAPVRQGAACLLITEAAMGMAMPSASKSSIWASRSLPTGLQDGIQVLAPWKGRVSLIAPLPTPALRFWLA